MKKDTRQVEAKNNIEKYLLKLKNKFMKHYLTFFLLIFTLCSFSQTLETEIDEFTDQKKIKTSWEALHVALSYTFFRISAYDDTRLFELKIPTGTYKSIIKEEGELMLKLTDGEIITLYSAELSTPCKGCGARGFGGSAVTGVHGRYYISESELKQVWEIGLEKFRVYFSDGYEDFKVMKKGKVRLKKAIELIFKYK